MSAPTAACTFIRSNSAGVNGPGLFRMYSGTASFPCHVAVPPLSERLVVFEILNPQGLRKRHRVTLYASNVTVSYLVLGVDGKRQSFDS